MERPLLRIPTVHMMTCTATSGISFHVFKNDKNAIVHSLQAKGITAYEKIKSSHFLAVMRVMVAASYAS